MMLVYGDAEYLEPVGETRAAIEVALAGIARMSPGLRRHEALVSAFINLGELVQGIADAEFEQRGFDGRSSAQTVGMDRLLELARAIDRSWRSRFAEGVPSGLFTAGWLDGIPDLGAVRIRQAEGYAFYGLYPESYIEAARLSGLSRQTCVIGIRSIGVGLAALVAAALDAPPPITLRPVSHPFCRKVRVDPALADEITADAGRWFAIVDEGPGFSGSSFGAVADWLEASGVARERIRFFPSHLFDVGPQASTRHRERWAKAARHSVSFDYLLLNARDPDHHLATWVEEVVGPLTAPLEDISGGTWREKRYADGRAWPAANIRDERRKFLAHAGGAVWLVKFAGLGSAGARKLDRARSLYEAGFTPEPVAYRHGFLIERWMERTTSLDRAVIDRARFVERIGAYLGFRARLPASSLRGASLGELLRMACYNTGEMLGEAAAATLERQFSHGAGLEKRVRRVDTDNRMQAHEWLIDSGGHIIKTDALDHSTGHDLVGCQDISWDIAGAVVEFDLSPEESARLCSVVGQEAGRGIEPTLLTFMKPCYLAFQMGAHALAAEAIGGAEAERLRETASRYAANIANLLARPEPAA